MPGGEWRNLLALLRWNLYIVLKGRDSFIFLVVTPFVIYPLLFLAGHLVNSREEREKQATELRLGLPESFREAERELGGGNIHLAFFATPPDRGTGREKFDCWVETEADPPAREFFAPGSRASAEFRVVYDSTRWQSRAARDHLNRRLPELNIKLADSRLRDGGHHINQFLPLKWKNVNLPSIEKKGAYMLGRILPILIVYFVLIAIFICADEVILEERLKGTLETLLLAPVTIKEIFLGKLLTVMIFAFLALLVYAVSGVLNCLLLVHFSTRVDIALLVNLSSTLVTPYFLQRLGLILLTVIPLAALLAIPMMIVGMLASSYQEAKNYLSVLFLLISGLLLPAGRETAILSVGTAFLPVANTTLLARSLLTDPINFPLLMLVFHINVFFVLALLKLSLRMFEKRDIILR